MAEVEVWRQFINLTNEASIDLNNCIEISVMNSNDVATSYAIKDIGDMGLNLLYSDVIIGMKYRRERGDLGLEISQKNLEITLEVRKLNKFFLTLIEQEQLNIVQLPLSGSGISGTFEYERVPIIKWVEHGKLIFIGALTSVSESDFTANITLHFTDFGAYCMQQTSFKEFISGENSISLGQIGNFGIFDWLQNDGSGANNKHIVHNSSDKDEVFKYDMRTLKSLHELIFTPVIFFMRQNIANLTLTITDNLVSDTGNANNRCAFYKLSFATGGGVGDEFFYKNAYIPFGKRSVDNTQKEYNYIESIDIENTWEFYQNLGANIINDVTIEYSLDIDTENTLLNIGDIDINYTPFYLQNSINFPYEYIREFKREDDLRLRRIDISNVGSNGEDLSRIEVSRKYYKNSGTYSLNSLYNIHPIVTKQYKRVPVAHLGLPFNRFLDLYQNNANTVYYLADEQSGLTTILDDFVTENIFVKVYEAMDFIIGSASSVNIAASDLFPYTLEHDYYDEIKNELHASSFSEKWHTGIIELQGNRNFTYQTALIILELFKEKVIKPVTFKINAGHLFAYLEYNEIEFDVYDLCNSHFFADFELSELMRISDEINGYVGDKYEAYLNSYKKHIIRSIEYDIGTNDITFEMLGFDNSKFL